MDNNPVIPEDDAGRAAFWREHVEAWRQSQLSQRGYARQHDLPIARFTYWKNKLYPSKPSGDFVEVNVSAGALVRIHHPSGMVIECMPDTSVRWLRDLLGFDDAS